MIISDHSPCTEDIKKRGDFINGWGGISSLQFGLSLTWTGASARGFSLLDVTRFLSANPAKLCGLDGRKGKIVEGADADFVIWEPEEKFTVAYRAKISLFFLFLLISNKKSSVCRFAGRTFITKTKYVFEHSPVFIL